VTTKFDDEGNIVTEVEDFFNQKDIESSIFELSSTEVRIALLRYFGYKPKEIAIILKKPIHCFYNVVHKTKKNHREKLKKENNIV